MNPNLLEVAYIHPPAHILLTMYLIGLGLADRVYGEKASFHLLYFMFIICTIFSLFYVQRLFLIQYSLGR